MSVAKNVAEWAKGMIYLSLLIHEVITVLCLWKADRFALSNNKRNPKKHP